MNQKNYPVNSAPLVVRMGALGDMVMLTPFLRYVFESTGKKSDLVVCGNWNRVLFANCPWVNKIHSVDSRNAPYWFNKSKRSLVAELKQADLDRDWFVFEHLPAIHNLVFRAGYAKKNGLTTLQFSRETGEHTCAQFLRIAQAKYPLISNELANPLATELHISDEQLNECNHWLAQKNIDPTKDSLVLIQAGNKKTMRTSWFQKRNRDSNIKYWPEKNWAQLIQKISQTNPHAKIMLCGAPSEKELCDDILQGCAGNSQVMQVADDLPLSRLMALASLAHSCISVDTGPAHIAAAVGCPLVVLFGKSDARQFRPIGKNNVAVVAQEDWQTFTGSANEWAEKNSMLSINVEQVFSAWKNITQEKNTYA